MHSCSGPAKCVANTRDDPYGRTWLCQHEIQRNERTNSVFVSLSLLLGELDGIDDQSAGSDGGSSVSITSNDESGVVDHFESDDVLR